MLDVCICTHNPRPAVLDAVIASLAAQTVDADAFCVTLIDNGSALPVSPDAIAPLVARGVAARIVGEPRTGLMHARLRAVDETGGDWMLFVDDDNVLAADFIQNGLAFIAAHPEVGAVGGRLLLPAGVCVPKNRAPFLPFLGVRDLGDEPRIGRTSVWVDYEPAGAGAFVRRDVLMRFKTLTQERPYALALGRSGGSLASCDDSLLMSCAGDVGLAVAYSPTLRLEHHIAPERFDSAYLHRLMAAYGESQVTLQRARTGRVEIPSYYAWLHLFAVMIVAGFVKSGLRSVDFARAQVGYHFAARHAFRTAAQRQRLSANSE